jgi:hypothetical protein
MDTLNSANVVQVIALLVQVQEFCTDVLKNLATHTSDLLVTLHTPVLEESRSAYGCYAEHIRTYTDVRISEPILYAGLSVYDACDIGLIRRDFVKCTTKLFQSLKALLITHHVSSAQINTFRLIVDDLSGAFKSDKH